jgi:hypothetical protein
MQTPYRECQRSSPHSSLLRLKPGNQMRQAILQSTCGLWGYQKGKTYPILNGHGDKGILISVDDLAHILYSTSAAIPSPVNPHKHWELFSRSICGRIHIEEQTVFIPKSIWYNRGERFWVSLRTDRSKNSGINYAMGDCGGSRRSFPALITCRWCCVTYSA